MTAAALSEFDAFDPDRILDRAIPLYWMFGRADVPLPVLAAETGATEAMLAATFGNADGAFRAALARYSEASAAAPYRAFAAAPDGQEAAAFATALLDLVFEEGVGRGCLLIQAIAVFAPRDPGMEGAVQRHVADLMALAGPAREARPAPRRLLAAHAAAATRARDGQSARCVAAAIEDFLFAPG